MRNDYMTALTDLNAPVSFGGGGRSGGGGAGDNRRSRYREDKEAGPRNRTTVPYTPPGNEVNREGKRDREDIDNNQRKSGWSGCVRADFDAKIAGRGFSFGGEICHGND